MSKLQKNPFKFGDPVEGDYYLPHTALSKTVAQFLENRIHVVLIGPRRFGKTSFVLDLLKNFEKKGYITLFVDIFNITSHRDFLQQMIRALKEKKRLRHFITDFLSSLPSLRPKISADCDDHTGKPSFEFTLDKASQKDVKEAIQDLLSGLEKMGSPVILAIDEFQKIAQIDDKGWLEATLRTHMQQMKTTSFLFTGSRRSIIYDMLNNQSRPLYRSCQPIEFPVFGQEFTDWIVQRFAEVGIDCDRHGIERLRELVKDTPNYVQMVCFHLIFQGKKQIHMHDIEKCLEMVVRQNVYAYQTLLNSLSATQQRALRLAAKENRQIFAKDLLAKFEIASGPALASALKALKDKGILDEEGTSKGKVIFDDPLFALWLKSI